MAEERKRLGKYEIQGILGRGGMGAVYRGFDPVIRRTVAIKTIGRSLLEEGGDNAVARFRNEARAAGRLSHPNIVAVYEYGEDDDVAFIAMEYVEGLSLKEILRQQSRMSISDAVGVALPLLEGLAHAHEQGVVHRDIKPANLIITCKGKLKIADFGVARIESSELTQVGTVIGTPCYMSPEQFMGAAVDARSDVFASGVVLFELLTGRRPFDGPIEAIAPRICGEPPPQISAVDPVIPRCFDEVLKRAMAKRPADRYASAGDFAEAIREAFQAAFHRRETPPLSEETVVLTARATVVAAERRDLATRSGPATASATEGQSVWQDRTLQAVERQLASFIGPLARIMVKRAAHETTTLHELYDLLATKLESERERQAFLRHKAALGLPSDGPPGAPTRTSPAMSVSVDRPGTPLSAETIERASVALARLVGPISRVMARRAAKSAGSAEAFIATLGAELANPDERAAFLRDMAGTPG